MKRKAQTQVITIVLISGIVISLVGTAYFWGIPLISKRTSITDYMTAEDFIVNLDSKIVDVANRGAGKYTLTIPKGLIRVIDYKDNNKDNNTLIFEILTNQPLISGETNVTLRTSVLGENATYGEAEPRIITMFSQSYGTGYKLIFKLHYRELDVKGASRGYKIALKRGSVTGTSQISVSYDGTEETTVDGRRIANTIIKVDAF